MHRSFRSASALVVAFNPFVLGLVLAGTIAVAADGAAAPASSSRVVGSPGDSDAGPGSFLDVERYLSIRSAVLTGLSPDAKTIAFLTNTTGSNQIWTISAQGGWPEQITFFSDRVTSVSWSPRGDWLAFSKDSGGDENHQLYLVSPDGVKLVPLTQDPDVRHNFGGWSRDGRWIAYSSNARNRKFFDVYIMNVDTREKRRIVQDDALFSAGPFSNDGKKIVLVRDNASLDNDLFVLDLADARGTSGPPVLLTPHTGLARHTAIGWTPDDSALWIVSDAGREFSALGRLDIASRRIAWVLEPSWDVTSASLSRDGTLLGVVVNEDGYDTLSILETTALKALPNLKIPRGSVAGFGFSQDSKMLALTLGSAARTPDVWLADLGTSHLHQVTHSSTAGISETTFVEPKLVRYKSFDGLEIPAFFYTPRPTAPAAGWPCLVLPHGGPEAQTTARFSATVQFWLSRGFAVWAPNVRGSTGYGRRKTHLDDVRKREDSVRDLAEGVTWLKESRLVDAARIGVTGGSYGGYMTLAAITLYPDLWAAAADSYGIANFRTFFGKTAVYRVGMRASEYGDPVADAAFLDSISPLFKADRIQAPLLVLQGANDPRVPRTEAEQIVDAVKKKGGAVEYVLFPDEGHGWTKIANQITALRTTAQFFERYLRARP